MTNSLSKVAIEYAKAGLSPIPTSLQKEAITKWGPYQKKTADESHIKKWFSINDRLLAIVAGRASGNVEILDFDTLDQNSEFFKRWSQEVESIKPGLIDKLLMETTKNKGIHFVYRCTDVVIPGNTDLAKMKIKVDGPGTYPNGGHAPLEAKQIDGEWYIFPVKIETRGEGGYCVVSPSSGYQLKHGSFLDLPIITAAEREILIDTAASLDQDIPLIKTPQKAPDQSTGLRPGDDFNLRGDLRGLLRSHGWVYEKNGGDGRERWRRPGKEKGHSATLTPDGQCFWVFSGNAYPFKTRESYDPFSVYTQLEHNGDFQAAARALSAQGYGNKASKNEKEQSIVKKLKVNGVGFNELKKMFSEKAKYIWMNRIALGMPSAVTGLPGIGKSTIAMAIIKEILEQHPEGMAIWVSTEGQTQDTLIKMGEIGGPVIDSSRFEIARHADGSFMFNFHRETERKALSEFLGNLPKPVLIVVIDSLRGASENLDENSKVMGDMMNRTQGYICDKHRAACLWIHDWNKKRNVPDAERTSGSTAIPGALRAVFSVTSKSEFVRCLTLTKKNLSDIATENLNVIKTSDSFLFYEDEINETTQLKKAERFLIQIFQEKKIQYVKEEIYESREANALGLKPTILKAAKKHLPIITYTENGVGTPWVWEWKESYRETEQRLSEELEEIDGKKPNKINEGHESHENLSKDEISSRVTRDMRVTRDILENNSDSRKNNNENNNINTKVSTYGRSLQENHLIEEEIEL